MSSASTAAQIVPKINGQTYDQKLSGRSEAVSFVATNAGRLCTMRKTATAARVTRIMLPAKTADREKMRSPRLSTGLAEDAEEVTGCFLQKVVRGAKSVSYTQLDDRGRERDEQRAHHRVQCAAALARDVAHR